MIEQVILVALFIGLLAFSALTCGMLLCSLIQIICFGFDFLSQKYSEVVSEINSKLGDDDNE